MSSHIHWYYLADCTFDRQPSYWPSLQKYKNAKILQHKRYNNTKNPKTPKKQKYKNRQKKYKKHKHHSVIPLTGSPSPWPSLVADPTTMGHPPVGYERTVFSSNSYFYCISFVFCDPASIQHSTMDHVRTVLLIRLCICICTVFPPWYRSGNWSFT